MEASMHNDSIQTIHADVAGQDDNLGDSALRLGYLNALAGPGRRFHLHGRAQSSDYLAGLALTDDHIWFDERGEWLRSWDSASTPVHVFNAGENNLAGQHAYPTVRRTKELAAVKKRGGVVIVAGIGVKNAEDAKGVDFQAPFRDADVLSWRDAGSREAAGFGDVNPDWAFALGSHTSQWLPADSRDLISVTLRFDRPYPDETWVREVTDLARATSRRIATVAQVGRDAPRAIRLAADLGGQYIGSPSFAHDVLDAHVRALYRRSLIVISDRAHGLIIGATEGAYPLGSAADPQKLVRLLDTVDLAHLVGRHDQVSDSAADLPSRLDGLAPAIDEARRRLARLTLRIQAALSSVAP